MTNGLKKHIIAEKFVKFGLYPLLLLVSFINPKSGLSLQSLAMVIRVRHLWNKTTPEGLRQGA
ncbi:hypothetical protein [Nostoc sp.]|uniref:hypothetical protein n=1 Tax=Nostoc sp. TaxID=1180 RepID=UPI002FF56B9A